MVPTMLHHHMIQQVLDRRCMRSSERSENLNRDWRGKSWPLSASKGKSPDSQASLSSHKKCPKWVAQSCQPGHKSHELFYSTILGVATGAWTSFFCAPPTGGRTACLSQGDRVVGRENAHKSGSKFPMPAPLSQQTSLIKHKTQIQR